MTDQNDPFADISQSLSDDSNEKSNEENTTETVIPSSSPTTKSNSQSVQSSTSDTEEPAFKFSEVEQFGWYALEEYRQEFENTRDFEVKRLLRDRGVPDVQQSELTNAALAVLCEHPEEWADMVEKIRCKR